jgi:hypothetical protein
MQPTLLGKWGKRVFARLQGKTFGTCHKCGASLKRGRSIPRANFCARCDTLYHTYDCGNRMAAARLAANPAGCPKVRRICIFSFAALPNLLLNTLTLCTLTKNMQPALNKTPLYAHTRIQCCNICRCASGPLECHSYRRRARKEKIRSQAYDRESHGSMNGDGDARHTK